MNVEQNERCNYINQVFEGLKTHSMEEFICNYCKYDSLCRLNNDELFVVPPCLNLELCDCITEDSFSEMIDVLYDMFARDY